MCVCPEDRYYDPVTDTCIKDDPEDGICYALNVNTGTIVGMTLNGNYVCDGDGNQYVVTIRNASGVIINTFYSQT